MTPSVRTNQSKQVSLIIPKNRLRGGVVTLALVVVTIVVLLGRSLATAPAPTNDYAKYHNKFFSVTRVLDGDTFDIAIGDGDHPTTRIRLWGVDTPELAHNGSDTAYFAKEATDFARQTLEGKAVQIVLSPEKTRGHYGRLLAYVFLQQGGKMFNEMLLEKGFAYADLRFDHVYKKRFEQFEKHARNQKIGLWAEVTVDQMPKWRQRFIR